MGVAPAGPWPRRPQQPRQLHLPAHALDKRRRRVVRVLEAALADDRLTLDRGRAQKNKSRPRTARRAAKP
eukprot:12536226-Alexandrium_andersonii.AAC.1